MTNEQIREAFNQAISNSTDADAIAKLELAREFFTNPEFRRALEEHIWQNRK